ncbi:exodeoxyribonuclease VII small subunit [Halonotius pteroides]|jgi:exodeoxyribonuclease VII small subunit|uniref:Exodeoxyribonuclease VII small subunit n=1 Tax=Halonotius pteroides TaxID=268735 RepID=A0A3A6QS71_9EURY|nr:exodeoxyribonuclease VII small subunit [Halonotius pteroides]RJX51770.1 exodeoxyribonuclease VII small subunit [Halonotius pteroides]
MSENTPVSDKVDRVEAIIEQLENGEVSLEEAQELREEGEELLTELEGTLAVGDGEIIEQ